MAEQCSKRVWPSGAFRSSPCRKPGKVEVDGRWFCGIHSPEGEAKRKEKRAQSYREYVEASKRRAAVGKYHDACIAAFNDPSRTIATENISEGLVWQLVDALRRSSDKLDMFISEHEDPGADAFAVTYCNERLLSGLKVEQSDAG